MRSIAASTIGSTVAVVTPPGEGLGGAIAGGQRAEQQVLGPDEVVLQPQRLPQRRVEHRFGPLVEGQVGHRVGGLGGDVEGGGEVRLRHPELAERLGPECLGFGVLGHGEVLGADRRRLGAAGEAVGRDQHRSGAIGEAAEGSPGGDQAGAPPGDRRCWAACLLTPIAAPIWLHGSPDRRAWSTKWPIRLSA